MIPRLIAISRHLKGTIFALSEKEISVGRDAANPICFSDQSVSRRHCLIQCDNDDRFFIQDLESFNGIFVNGVPVNRKEIKHGDQIGIGDIILFFLTTESEETFDPDVFVLTEGVVNEHSTIKLARKDAIYLSPEKLFSEFPQMARAARDLSVLLRITSALNQAKELDEAQERLLELIAEAIPAERGAILLTKENDLEFFSPHIWSCGSSVSEFTVSRTIVNQCLTESVSILCNDISNDERFHQAESLTASNTCSVLCTPLLVLDRVIGVIYLDTSNRAAAFDMDHLQLLTGISDICSRPLENAIDVERLKLENQRLRDQLEHNYQMIGESKKMKEVFNTIARIAPVNSTVTILGDSGTGKELAARAIHQNSNRNKQPFVVINCATLTENLLESELFGHERGAFTGAIGAKKGQFEAADGGTIFLDEIGELPLPLQAKLLRVLQERELKRVGSLKSIKIDVRVIAATNRNLEEEVKNGGFRQDLYYRLNVITLLMPSLRERPEDMALLTRYFINKYNQKCNRKIKGIVPEAMKVLQDHPWSGNVRELENVIERAVIFALGDMITLDDLPESLISHPDTINNYASDSSLNYRDAVFKARKEIVEQAICRTNNNITEAARVLGIHPNNLHRLIKQLNLRCPIDSAK